MGLPSMPFMALTTAVRLPCAPPLPMRDRAMHSELVINRSTTMVTMTGPEERGPSKVNSNGTPMKPVFGKAATSAPKAALFQSMRWLSVMAMVTPTMISAHSR